MQTAPALLIMGDALQPIWDKLSAAILFHDLGCRYGDCKVRGTTDEVSDMWSFLATLHDPVALHAGVLRFTSNQTHINADWQSVFQAIDAQHATHMIDHAEDVIAALGG